MGKRLVVMELFVNPMLSFVSLLCFTALRQHAIVHHVLLDDSFGIVLNKSNKEEELSRFRMLALL